MTNKTLINSRLSFLSSMTLCLLVFGAFQLAIGADKPMKQSLWPGSPPKSQGKITVHHPSKPNGTAIVICPGGGYRGLVTGAEGHGIAKWLNNHGITGIVLEYELPNGRSFVPLHDAQRAIRLTRANATNWKLNPKRIGIIGFSAGGHVASTVGTHFDAGDSKTSDLVERQSCRPDFLILVYPVISMGEHTHQGSKRNLLGSSPSAEMIELFSNETQVTPNTPPAYLAHALDDKVVVPANSRMFHEALKDHKVPTEYLELPSGGHGLNGYKGPMWDAWQTGALKWLAKQKMIR